MTMPGSTLGLEIGEEAITAVVVRGGIGGREITACGRVSLDGGRSAGEGLEQLLRSADLRAETCAVAVPPAQVFFRNLRLPFSDPRKLRQTLPFQMEPLVPVPIDELVVDFTCRRSKDHSEVLAAALEKPRLRQLLDWLATHGLDPESVQVGGAALAGWLIRRKDTPADGLLLELGERACRMLLFLDRRIVLARSLGLAEDPAPDSLAGPIRRTLHALAWQSGEHSQPRQIFLSGPAALLPETQRALAGCLGLPVTVVDAAAVERLRLAPGARPGWSAPLMNGALALALQSQGSSAGLDFRRGEFEPQRRRSGLRRQLQRAAVFAGLIGALLAADLLVEARFLESRAARLDREIREEFRRAFPEVTRIVDPLQQARIRLREARGSILLPESVTGGTTVELLREISLRVPPSLDVLLTRMVVDSQRVRLSGETDTYNTVDGLQGALERSSLFSRVTIHSAQLDREGRHVQFELSLERRGGE